MSQFFLYLLAVLLWLGAAAIGTWVPGIEENFFFIVLILIMTAAGVASLVAGITIEGKND
jgi:hypothetical protein